jgi:hypothetical protein
MPGKASGIETDEGVFYRKRIHPFETKQSGLHKAAITGRASMSSVTTGRKCYALRTGATVSWCWWRFSLRVAFIP